MPVISNTRPPTVVMPPTTAANNRIIWPRPASRGLVFMLHSAPTAKTPVQLPHNARNRPPIAINAMANPSGFQARGAGGGSVSFRFR